MTADGTLSTAVEAIVTARDLAPAFGDQPAAFARDIRRASTIEERSAPLTRRSRAIALEYLTGASAVDWIPLPHLGDVAHREETRRAHGRSQTSAGAGASTALLAARSC